jgi:hypothetical protein
LFTFTGSIKIPVSHINHAVWKIFVLR